MAIFPMGANPFGAGMGGFNIPSISMRVTTSMFFDRAAVKASLSAMNYKALSKGSMRIKDYAKRSIRKMGAARPALKLMRDNPGVRMAVLAARPTTSNRTRNTLNQRILEIQTRPPSAPGTPPNTHVPYGHMLGFRRNLWNFYDGMSQSAVVGPSRKGKMLPFLHEFGGSQTLQTWVWVYRNRWAGSATIVRNLPVGQKPADPSKWIVTSQRRRVNYPERPYMHPAMLRAIANGDLAKAFGGQFSVSQAARGTFIKGS